MKINLRTWRKVFNFKCKKCNGDLLYKHWVVYVPKKRQVEKYAYKIRCKTCSEEWIQDKI